MYASPNLPHFDAEMSYATIKTVCLQHVFASYGHYTKVQTKSVISGLKTTAARRSSKWLCIAALPRDWGIEQRQTMDIKTPVELIGLAFELAGVVVLAFGAVLAFARLLVSLIRLRDGPVAYRHLRLYLGRSIMIGLELLIAADIIHSVAVDPTFTTVGVLGLIVLVRTFLSWSIDVEINGEWPWHRARFHKGEPPGKDEL
jgi:uncharacterized membrane protein